MLDFPMSPDSSLSFADALFSTNRFPVFSQAAEIQAKGHFVDGGAFDNSGIGSLLDLLENLETYHDRLYQQYKGNVVLISIHNDGTSFVRNHFESFRDSLNRVDPTGEISPLISVGASRAISGEPYYWDERLGQLEQDSVLKAYIEVDLPYRLSRKTVQSRYNGQIESVRTLQQEIDLLNRYTWEVLPDTQYVVEPPLGRIMSTPVVHYMQNMVEHKLVQKSLNEIVSISQN